SVLHFVVRYRCSHRDTFAGMIRSAMNLASSVSGMQIRRCPMRTAAILRARTCLRPQKTLMPMRSQNSASGSSRRVVDCSGCSDLARRFFFARREVAAVVTETLLALCRVDSRQSNIRRLGRGSLLLREFESSGSLASLEQLLSHLRLGEYSAYRAVNNRVLSLPSSSA